MGDFIMASIINASTTSTTGLVQSADASGVLQLQTNGSAGLTLESNTNITIHNSMNVSGSVNVSANVTTTRGAVTSLVSGTIKDSTSGTSVDFTGIPSWVKRITLMLSSVSTSGTSNYLVQLGDSGGVEITGYTSASSTINTTAASTSSTAGYIIRISAGDGAATVMTGSIVLTLITTNTWVAHGVLSAGTATPSTFTLSGVKTLSDTLTTVRVTTVNGTDTFDAGSINILYE